MKRYRIKSNTRFITFILILLIGCICLFVSIFGLNAVNSAEKDGITYKTVDVVSGDTIWSLAESYAKGQDIRKVVFDIREVNHLDDTVISPGETIRIPVYD